MLRWEEWIFVFIVSRRFLGMIIVFFLKISLFWTVSSFRMLK